MPVEFFQFKYDTNTAIEETKLYNCNESAIKHFLVTKTEKYVNF